MNRLILSLILVLSLLLGTAGFCEETQQQTEGEMLARIAEDLRADFIPPHLSRQPYDESFCECFLEDLKAQRGIEFIRPILQTDNYNDPGLQAYLGKCPSLQLNKTMPDRVKSLPEGERENTGEVWYTNCDFRLYRVDFDNDPKNGEEYLFYGGGMYNLKRKITTDLSGYRLVDFNKCKIVGGKQVSDTVDYVTRRPTGSYTGVLKYKGRYYIYDAEFWPRSGTYSLRLHKWYKEIKSKISLFCQFVQKPSAEEGGKK
ncbi:MAG: hypothetical protein AB1711_07680 [Thermodesulfobacteriota bacterium]